MKLLTISMSDHNVIVAQPDSERYPLKSFKLYLSQLSNKTNVFFQTPNQHFTNPKYDQGYKKTPVGENTLGNFMPTISQKANLSKYYTNHKIKGTTATIMTK